MRRKCGIKKSDETKKKERKKVFLTIGDKENKDIVKEGKTERGLIKE